MMSLISTRPHGRWRNIFLIEGAITMLLGFVGFRFLPRSPDNSGFLTERERTIAMERIRVENAGLVRNIPKLSTLFDTVQVEEEHTDFELVLRAWFNMTNWICAVSARPVGSAATNRFNSFASC